MRKLLALGASSLFTFTALVNADYDDAQLRNLENRVCCLEQTKGCYGMINPAARPVVECGADLFITGDFLYWQGQENGLGYVIKNFSSFNGDLGSVGSLTNARVKNVSRHWNPGFRIGVGYNMPHDGWDMYLNWTRFYTSHESSQTVPFGGALIPTLINPLQLPHAGVLTTASARQKLHLNVLDFELGREFFVSKYLTLRPFGGLRSAWLNQRYKVDYGYISAGILTDVEPKFRNKFWGFGLRTGLDTQWGLGEGFSIYADGAISLLYGYFNVTGTQTTTTGSGVAVSNLSVKDNPRIGRAITDLAAGLRWEDLFSCDSFRLRIQAGWEQHMYFGQNQYLKFVDSFEQGFYTSNQGDITFQGWVLNAQIDF